MAEDNPIYVVDAFTDEPFTGNPAAICLMMGPLDDPSMQRIASEVNLSETAFLYPMQRSTAREYLVYSLRWFTPKVEVPLCGHVTLASAHVIFNELGSDVKSIIFKTLSGDLVAKRDPYCIALDFPMNRPEPFNVSREVLDSMGIEGFKEALLARKAKKLLIHFEDWATV